MTEKPEEDSPQLAGPYVRAALLCDQVIEGKDGTNTIVRMIDRFTPPSYREVEIEPGRFEPRLQIRASLFVSFTGIPASAPKPISFAMRGETAKQVELDLIADFEPSASLDAINVIAQLVLSFDVGGRYWIDVSWDGRALTSIPFELVEPDTKQPAADVELSQ